MNFVQSICPLEFACLRFLGGGPTSCQNTPPLYLPNHCPIRDSEISSVYPFCTETCCTENTHIWSKMSFAQVGPGCEHHYYGQSKNSYYILCKFWSLPVMAPKLNPHFNRRAPPAQISRGDFCVFCLRFQALAFSCPPCLCQSTQFNLYFLLSLTTPETLIA